MSLTIGIVGLPNVGKSTLFNALTKAGIAAENYPFCTIEPNVGIVEIPDPRLAALAAIAKPQKVIPATVEFVDIAGLVAGASKGEGLGNQFLATIRDSTALLKAAGDVDKQITKVGKLARAGGDKDAQRTFAVLSKVRTALNQARPARTVDLYDEERALLKPYFPGVEQARHALAMIAG